MTLTVAASAPSSTPCDALLIAIMPGKGKSIVLAAHGLTTAQGNRLVESASALGATGKAGELTVVPSPNGFAAKKVVLVGLGAFAQDPDVEAMRTSVGAAVRSLSGSRKIAIVASPYPDHIVATALAALLGGYVFTEYKGKSKPKSATANIVLLVPKDALTQSKSAASTAIVLADSVNLSRDLVNTPPNALTPIDLAAAATSAVEGLPVKVTIWDEKALKRDGCGGILGVGQGSVNPPRLVKMEYSPADATASLAIVGKGITFDTGGISIKPAAGMDEMKGDMGGAAAVIGAMQAIAKLGINVKVTGWVPTAENMPSGNAQRPGDVITMFDGTTVEVLNTDAEGRLVLADALGMAVLERPDLIIDVATLTGAQRIALGSRTAGVMANNDDSRTLVCTAAEEAGEAAWPMPLPEYLRASIDSPTADIANIGDRLGGMLSAGIFLKEFIPDGQPWVHIDIAGPSFNDKAPYGYTPKGGTGSTVRTFVQVARTLAAG